MIEKKLEICSLIKLVAISWENKEYPVDVSIDYIERSPAHGFSDTETSIDISREKALEIIEFLQSAFELINPPQGE